MKSRLLIFIFSITSAVLIGAPAYACSCLGKSKPEQVVQTTPHIFWGRATKEADNGTSLLYTFEIWTEKSTIEIKVITPKDSASCGRRFALNKTELFGAHFKDGVYRTTLCNKLDFDAHRNGIIRILDSCKPFGRCP